MSLYPGFVKLLPHHSGKNMSLKIFVINFLSTLFSYLFNRYCLRGGVVQMLLAVVIVTSRVFVVVSLQDIDDDGCSCACFDPLAPDETIVPPEDDYFTAPFQFDKPEM